MEKFEELKKQLKKIPGIGEKSAERISFFLLTKGRETALNLSTAISEAMESMKICSNCGALTEHDPCDICTSKQRNGNILMLVEKSRDVFIFEKSNFKGKYHVLGGLLSPIDGVNPDNLSIEKLIYRIKNENIDELILSLSPSTEGEATAMYISDLLKGQKIHISRIAYGIPFGSNFEYIDEYTLSKSLENRKALN